ncbi:hypothetical protein [Arsenophonus endosymbiont of Aleurodicus floccissimus]|nr:hypothetical protein [Arsenophonus endosymbiont of Aleurodicus floccissimus]
MPKIYGVCGYPDKTDTRIKNSFPFIRKLGTFGDTNRLGMVEDHRS